VIRLFKQEENTMIREESRGVHARKVDTQEFELPETLFVRDIENKVFQGIALHCLAKIDGISLLEGNFIDNILGREGLETVRGIHAEQDNKHQCVSIKIEINVGFGVSIPEKAEEIQTKVAEEITKMTGLHVAMVHVIFKGIVPKERLKKISEVFVSSKSSAPVTSDGLEEYNEEF
jgi:uncharacterized alkaline shock family protein YloU